MLERIIGWSLSHRLLVCMLAVVVALSGLDALRRLPLDAFPDTTPVQVQVNTVAPSLSPVEIEQQITLPVERALGGLSGLVEVRSISKFGLSQVTAVFDDGTDVYLARQVVGERLQTAVLPEGVARPEMGPVATGLGEIFHYVVSGEGWSLEELTTLHDWEIRPRLLSVRGVAEVNTWGGLRRQYQVLLDVARLVEHGLTFDDVREALERNNLTVGGGNLASGGELQLVRGIGLVTDEEQIGDIVLAAQDGVPIRVRDVAEVVRGHEIRRGAATAGGEGEVVLGLGFLLLGENGRAVTRRLEERLERIRADLPEGVDVQVVHARTELVDQVIATVRENLLEGALLVVAVLFAFLGSLRAGLVVAAAIPLSMLFAFDGMLRFGIAGSLMSLGAIDFGLVVDSSVILVENGSRRLAESPGRSRLDTIREASLEVRRPTLFGELIIMIVYLPVLALEGVEGKLFRPMALTVILALTGSLVLSLTLIPVLASLLLPRRPLRGASWMTRRLEALYAPCVRLALRARALVVAGALVLLAAGALLATRLGSEFVPRLSEGSVVINTVRLAGVSLDESVRYGTRIERVLLQRFPDEIERVWTRTGTAAVATDPMGLEVSDVFLDLHPRQDWRRAASQDELVGLLRDELADLPGMRAVFTQPIEMRVNEMVAGIRADLGVKVFGDDLDVLAEVAGQVAEVLRSVPGSRDVVAEQVTGQPVLEVEVDRHALARHGVPARHVLELVEAIGGTPVGEVRQGQRRFDLVLRLDERHRRDAEAVAALLVPAAGGELLPLERLAAVREVVGPSTVTHEWQERRVLVQSNVAGRDVGGFVTEARQRLEQELDLPPGVRLEYGGQFEHLERARARLTLIVPLALALVLLLLHASTGSLRTTLIVFTGAPFAALGGVLALWLRDMPFTISAGVGFVAVSGVAMLNGLVLTSTVERLREEGVPLLEAIERGARTRLRPVLMTALVAGLGFVPMAFNTGVGAEVQRPLATVVIGGVVSDNLLTLAVLPALLALFPGRSAARPGAAEGASPLSL